MHRPITWLLIAVVASLLAIFFLADLVRSIPPAIAVVTGHVCPDGASEPDCIATTTATVLATRTYPRRWWYPAHELTLHDASGRHLENMVPEPPFDRVAPGDVVLERRVNGRLLSITLEDGSTLPVEKAPPDAVVFDFLMLPLMLVGGAVGARMTAASRRDAGWWEPIRDEPLRPPAFLVRHPLLLITLAIGYPPFVMSALLLKSFGNVTYGVGAPVGGVLALVCMAWATWTRRRLRRNRRIV